jgi:hypothetical protein
VAAPFREARPRWRVSVNRFRCRAEPAPFIEAIKSYAQKEKQSHGKSPFRKPASDPPQRCGNRCWQQRASGSGTSRSRSPSCTNLSGLYARPPRVGAWLKGCGIETVALESTGIYWISLYEVLEQYGFEVRLVNARHVKNVPGRSKSDVLDCQWIRKLHSFGLLNGSFRPDQQIRKLRTYMRLKDNLVAEATPAIHHSMRSTNPIWRLAPVFGQLGSWNEKRTLVIVGNGVAGRKCGGWSMNLKRADWRGRSFAESEIWR